MDLERLNPNTMMKPLGSYCQAARRGPFVAIAGVAAIDADGKLVGGQDIVAQTRATLENMRLALDAAGAGFEDVLNVTCYITDFANYAGFNEAFDEVFADCPPARASVRADLVIPELLIEMDALAVLPSVR